MKVLSNLNMGQNELKGLVVDRLAVAPSNPKEGQLYYNTTTRKIYIYEAGAWLALTNNPVVPTLLVLTQAEYDALETKDENTYYYIKEGVIEHASS